MAELIRGAPELFPVTLSPLDGAVPAPAPRKRRPLLRPGFAGAPIKKPLA